MFNFVGNRNKNEPRLPEKANEEETYKSKGGISSMSNLNVSQNK